MINARILHVTGETFVEPDIIPPAHCDQIAEPLPHSFRTNPALVSSIFVKRRSKRIQTSKNVKREINNKKLSYRRESAHLTSLYRTVQKVFQYVKPFRHGPRV